MASKRRLDDDFHESSNEDPSDFDDTSSNNDTDDDYLEIPEGLEDDSEDSSEDSEKNSTDEYEWQEETDLSSTESETDSDSDRSPSRHVRLAMQSLGLSKILPINTTSESGGRQRCHVCPRICDRKVATQCSICHFPCCPNHHKIICNICLKSCNANKKKNKK